ncbi:uncharacterized protein EI90DRAFT_3123750 [Cantharellus anzutake]|uniref:uncharacterized protein n=1 Tax=Cantharellus anzutake TaxID=1750568 RepID=UPI00190776EF|nr:uncharacterized protein EI90DRAFT_3123750 [Cantharellus anzutake]KAF8331043.1 hypothetical protein EI90DRAFT_3123750 [Cantharellus anzutake]
MPPRGRKCKNEDPQPEDQRQALKWVHNSTETKPAIDVKEEKLKGSLVSPSQISPENLVVDKAEVPTLSGT